MKHYGLLGYPLSHSFSKGYFTEKFGKEGIDAVYENHSLQNIQDFPSLITDIPELVGLNVTIPHKQAVIPYLDALDAEAAEIGAVNTIRVETSAGGKRRLIGYNTDLIGFRESIRPLMAELKIRLDREPETCGRPLRALVLGTGGASRAILYGLKQLGCEVLLVSRQSREGRMTYQELTPEKIAAYSILVNTTPLGMYPETETCPPIPYDALGSCHLLFDAVYNPEKTLFLKKGEERGALIKNGLEMLHRQAEAAWEIWNRT